MTLLDFEVKTKSWGPWALPWVSFIEKWNQVTTPSPPLKKTLNDSLLFKGWSPNFYLGLQDLLWLPPPNCFCLHPFTSYYAPLSPAPQPDLNYHQVHKCLHFLTSVLGIYCSPCQESSCPHSAWQISLILHISKLGGFLEPSGRIRGLPP